MSEDIRVLPFSGQQVDWDEWSEKYQGIGTERWYLKVMLGTERVPGDALNIDQKVDNNFVFFQMMIGNRNIKQEK